MSDEEKIAVPSPEEVARYAGGSGAVPADQAAEPVEGSAEPGAAVAPPSPENDWKDIALRARAELSNFQKRAEKDRADALRYANASLVKALLAVVDNLERIVQSATDATGNAQAVVDGARLTLDMFLKVLRDFHVEAVVSEGQPFDPQVHEAMMERPSDHAERMVLQEVAKGYRLYDRVIRPAKVIVSKPAPQAQEMTNDE